MIKIAICQFNSIVGAVSNNANRLSELAREALIAGAQCFIAPELVLCGYPPKDLILNPDFLEICKDNLKKIANTAPIPMLLGAPEFDGSRIYNSAFLCFNENVQLIARKQLLPNYQVFDEKRYFTSGLNNKFYGFEFNKKRFGVSICEDAWSSKICDGKNLSFYNKNPIENLVLKYKADIIINLSASPFEREKPKQRENLFKYLAKYYARPVILVGQVGANDGLIFDGGSLFANYQGKIISKAKTFKEDLLLIEV